MPGGMVATGDRTLDRRVRSLDGLRCLAASIVVVQHLLLASVAGLAALYLGGANASGAKVSWAGPEAIIVFFVLSGLVLSLGAAAGKRFVASFYYPCRLARLYVPVWGALIVAAVAHEVIVHRFVPGATWWLNGHAGPLTLHRAAFDSTLVYEAGDGQFSSVLWTLRWEVIFSVLLPAFLFVGSRVRWDLLVVATIVVIAFGGGKYELARYLAPFMLGVALAYGRGRITEWMTPRKARLLLIGSIASLTADWWLRTGFVSHIGLGLVAAGATGLVTVAMCPGSFANFLNSRPLRLVGQRSFTLYLVHEPIVVAAAFALGGRPSVIVLAAVSLPVIAIVTEVFYRYVERPTHRLARSLGTWSQDAVTRFQHTAESVLAAGEHPTASSPAMALSTLARPRASAAGSLPPTP